jgi:Right handed beta helix region
VLRRVFLSAGLTAAALTMTAHSVGTTAPAQPGTMRAEVTYVALDPHEKTLRSLPESSPERAALVAQDLLETPPATTTKSLFVSPTGDDGAPGTPARPLRTIKKASQVVTPGTAVHVAAGRYEGPFTTNASGKADAQIAYVSDVKHGAKIINDGGGMTWLQKGDYVDVIGFEVSGSNGGGIMNEGSFVHISDNHVHGFKGGDCIVTERNGYSMHDIDIVGNITHDCGSSALQHGIYVSHPNGRVSNNVSYGNAGYGIHCWHNCNKLIISNNLVFNNHEGGMVIGQGDKPNNGSVNADNFVVANNIAVHNANYGIKESGATGSHNTYSNNCVFENEKSELGLNRGKESKTIKKDPQFVNFKLDGTGDLRLKPSSPLINAGTAVGAPLLDLLGRQRPIGGGVDIGAYES